MLVTGSFVAAAGGSRECSRMQGLSSRFYCLMAASRPLVKCSGVAYDQSSRGCRAKMI